MSRRAVTLWLTDEEFASVDGAAARLGVETGALCRLALASGIVLAGYEVSAGRVRLRARSSRVPVPAAAVSRSARVDVVRGGRVVGDAVADVDSAGYPIAASVRPVEDGAVVSGVDSKTVPVLPSRLARADAFRRATQR